MSVVTDVILITGIFDRCDTTPTVDLLNKKITVKHDRPLVRIDHHAGGDKVMESDVYAGAFNYLDRDWLIEAVRSMDWEDPDRVQLLIKGHEENQFTSYAVAP
jgi:hypothetical protein